MKRMKKIPVILLMVFILMPLMFTTVFAEQSTPQRPAFAGKLLEITPRRVTDTFDYLTKFYVEKHPEAALIYNIADETDRNAIHRMAQLITEGCTTDKQKADAIEGWLDNYITYDVDASAYANDAFYNRIGNCMSYANLMQAMLRSLGIPAVVGDGWRGDMSNVTVDLFNQPGHAWCFVLLNDQWVLYDPLWLNGGTTDREYMANWIYFDTVDNIVPASDADNLPPVPYDQPQIYYTDGSFYCYSDFLPHGVGNFTRMVNNMSVNFTSNQCEKENGISDGWYILTGDQNKDNMFVGEVYQDGWISYGEYETGEYLRLTYAFPNGMQIDGAVMEFGGVKRLMECNMSFPILADEEDYSIQYGTFALKKGYSGPFLGMSWGDYQKWKDCVVTISSENEAVATVDANGIISCHSVGFATFKILLEENGGDNALYSISYVDVYVTDEDRVPNFEINPNIGKNGWVSDGGKWYFYENGNKVIDAWCENSEGWVYLGADGAMVTNKWVTDSNGRCYLGEDGLRMKNAWIPDSQGIRRVDESGYVVYNSWIHDGFQWRFVDTSGYVLCNAWQLDFNGRCYLGEDGYMMRNAWIPDSQGIRRVDQSGYVVYNSWIHDGFQWRFVDTSGYVLCNAWQLDSKGWCYVGEDGYMLADTWHTDSQGLCYIGAEGYCEVNVWKEYEGKKLYLDGNGSQVKNTWLHDGNDWLYLGFDGFALTEQWMNDSAGWCYLGEDGYMMRDAWIPDTQGLCRVNADGYLVTSAWIHDGIGWRYVDGNGRVLKNAWQLDSLGWCYVGEDGYMLADTWHTDSQGLCYIGSEGYCLVNTWKEHENGWVYLDANGSQVKNNWVLSGGKWYFMDANGYMISNTSKYWNGKEYYFNASGVCTNP